MQGWSMMIESRFTPRGLCGLWIVHQLVWFLITVVTLNIGFTVCSSPRLMCFLQISPKEELSSNHIMRSKAVLLVAIVCLLREQCPLGEVLPLAQMFFFFKTLTLVTADLWTRNQSDESCL